MFSGCPSVRQFVRPSEARNTLFPPVQGVRWSIRPTMIIFRPVCPDRFSGISRTHGGNGLKFCMLMYPDHLQNWIDYGHGLLIFLLLASLWLGLNKSNLGFPGISWRMHRGNCLQFCTLMYLNNHQNCLDYSHGLLIFLILALFWLRETGQICGFRAYPREHIEGIAWNFACWCILTTFRTD